MLSDPGATGMLPVPLTVLHTAAVTGFKPPLGIWRPITTKERQHNNDQAAMLSALADTCSTRQRQQQQRGRGACVDDTWVLLIEDDFEPCPGFLDDMEAVLHHRCVRVPLLYIGMEAVLHHRCVRVPLLCMLLCSLNTSTIPTTCMLLCSLNTITEHSYH